MAKTITPNAERINWNIFTKSEAIKTIDGIEVEPIRVELLPEIKAKFQVKIKFAQDEPKILNLPQTIHSIYPIILQRKPKIIIHGYLNRKTGDCHYVIVKEKQREPLSTKKMAFNLMGFHVFSLAGQVKRIVGSTGQYSRHLRQEMQDALRPSELLKKPDYAKDQAFLASWTDEDVKRSVKQTTIFSILFISIGLILTALGMIGVISLHYVFLLPFFVLPLFLLQQRYEAKHRQRIKFLPYLKRLIVFKGF